MSDKVKKLSKKNSVEQNRKVLEHALWNADTRDNPLNPEGTGAKSLRESFKRDYNLDIADEKAFPVLDPNFSFKKAYQKLRESSRFREANSSSTFTQLLRAGVQAAFNNMVKVYTDTTYEKWVQVVSSDKDTELYAPLHGLSFLSERGPGEKFAETNMAGLDIKLKNRQFGQIFAVEQELMDDDQTGQVASLVSDLSEYAMLLNEIYCYAKLASVSGMSAYGLSIPSSETKPSTEANYPYTLSSAKFVGGGWNKATPAPLTQANLQAGVNQLLNQLNLLGIKMVVDPSMLTVSPHYQFDAAILLKSVYNPTATGAAGGGTVTGAFGINPIPVQNPMELNVTRFLFDNSGSIVADSKAWFLHSSKKPWFVLQLREPGTVIMENPESGASFERKLVRHRLSIRMNADHIEPRFVYMGSDGSA